MNKTILIGNTGKDPETRTFDNGTKVANLSIATSEFRKLESGERETMTEWHNLVFFGKLADVVEKYVKKGDKIAVVGKLRTRKWTDNNSVDRWNTEIIVNDLEMLGNKPNDNASTPPQNVPDSEIDDLPF